MRSIFLLSASLFLSQATGLCADKSKSLTQADAYKLCTVQKKPRACLSLAYAIWNPANPTNRKIALEYIDYACKLGDSTGCETAQRLTIDSEWTIPASPRRLPASTNKKRQ